MPQQILSPYTPEGTIYYGYRREAEMTLLQPHLGETRCQELRNSPFWHSSLFKSQLVKEGEDFLLKKGTSKDSQGFGPYQKKPFRGPHNKKRGSYRKRPYGGNSSQSSNQSFSSGRRKPNFRGSRGRFRPHNRRQEARAWKPLSPMTP